MESTCWDAEMNDILFSIIVPVYNKEKFLSKCLSSLLEQDYPYFEVLCIDDCSTDTSPQIVEQFARKDSRFVLMKNGQNQGVSKCRNIGINMSKGEWLLFVDADDYLSSNALKLIYDSILKKESCELVLFNGQFDNGSGFVSGRFFDEKTIGGIPESRLFRVREFDRVLHYVNAAVTSVRREFLLKHSIFFSPGMRHEDWEFMWHIFAFNPQILYLPAGLYFYVHDPEGYSSSKKTLKQSLDLFRAYEMGRQHFISHGCWTDVEYSAILVAIRHFWDFLMIKVSDCDDVQFKLQFAYTLKGFLENIPETLFLSIVSNPRFLANKKTIIEIRNSNSPYKMLWIVNKVNYRTRYVVDELRNRFRRFFTPFISLARWGLLPFRCCNLFLKYIKYQLRGMRSIKSTKYKN